MSATKKQAVPVVGGPHDGLMVETTFIFWGAMGYWHPRRTQVELIDPEPERPILTLEAEPEELWFTTTIYYYVRGRKNGRDTWYLAYKGATGQGPKGIVTDPSH